MQLSLFYKGHGALFSMIFIFSKKEGIVLKRILKYVQKYKVLVILPFLAMIISIGLDLINPYVSKILVDKVIVGGNHKLLLTLLLSILTITILKGIFGYVEEYLFDVLSVKVHKDIKIELFNHIEKLEFAYFDKVNTGELMSRIAEDIENIWRSLSFGLRLLLENLIHFVFGAVALFWLSPKLAVACIITMIPVGFLAMNLEKKEGEVYEKISDQNAEMNTTAEENIAGVRLIKAFSREKHEILKFLKMNKKYYKLNMEQANVLANHLPLMDFFTNLSLIVMISLGGYFVLKGEMTLGALVAFNGYIWGMLWSMENLGWLTNMFAETKASAKKVFKILDTEPKISNCQNAIIKENIEGDIEFKNVSFKYKDEEVLKNINFKAEKGMTIAIMGTTGSGKSSLISLIGRNYDVSKGEVLVDGIDVKKYDLFSLRNNISIVPQDVFLFSDSVKNNLKLGLENASEEELKNASKLACAGKFVNNLPKGYDTVVGERGIGLSGGQKQRLSIARALIKKAPILILDDSTSALDMETEFQLLKNLNEQEKSCTTFIIAHRISAVKNADLILFMENGEIIESGNHSTLIKKQGKYYEIYKEQFKDFIENVDEEEAI